jgi:hypothetical protein
MCPEKRGDFMYSTVITFKENIPEDVLRSLKKTCENAFDNRAGKVNGKSDKRNSIVFEGNERLWNCLNLGMVSLYKSVVEFKEHVVSWAWIDEDPSECCDMLNELEIPIY